MAIFANIIFQGADSSSKLTYTYQTRNKNAIFLIS
jgi:hypothetical protein